MKTLTILTVILLIACTPSSGDTLRVATFNTSLSQRNEGDLLTAIESRAPQVLAIAEIIQRLRPDIILLNEFDFDTAALTRFIDVLNTPQNTTGHSDSQAIEYDHSFIAPSNTGVPSGYDLDGNEQIGGPGDAYGFGYFQGQYGMAVLSRIPIKSHRSFQTFLWSDMPDNVMPKAFYSKGAQAAIRLSSKSHWDIVVELDGQELHLLAAHPTPPVFDGPEDRNGRRNHDEIRFWADYISGANYIYDDQQTRGGLGPDTHFVIAGDYNADPYDGESRQGAIWQLLDHPLINATAPPQSLGGLSASQRQQGSNTTHRGNPAFDTADFGFNKENPQDDRAPGNLRADYVLPSKSLTLIDSGIFWLTPEDPLFALAEWPTSNHRLVWIDIKVPKAFRLKLGT